MNSGEIDGKLNNPGFIFLMMQFSVHFLAGTGNTGGHCVGLEWKPRPSLAGLGNCSNPHMVCLSSGKWEMGLEGSAALLGVHPFTKSQAWRSTGFNSTLSQAAA